MTKNKEAEKLLEDLYNFEKKEFSLIDDNRKNKINIIVNNIDSQKAVIVKIFFRERHGSSPIQLMKAGIPREKAHPHVLRHSRAMEMIKAGIPLTIIQNVLGHATLNSAAVYLKFSNVEARMLLKEKGLI